MRRLKGFVSRIGRENTVEHAVAQVAMTVLMVLVLAPTSIWLSAAVLVAIAVFRGFPYA